ncbi:hypothetical protein [Weissella paramesenteroides]|uniref:hypothetical protein n=1 Tax=Weissella paramesenteroides TaxID=1249 RepID=UPI00223BA2D5|nr:hypothetical protein [Weissella paramesenteroides]MCT0484866.1 hypothetical protein [Weissella paramesenteroides]
MTELTQGIEIPTLSDEEFISLITPEIIDSLFEEVYQVSNKWENLSSNMDNSFFNKMKNHESEKQIEIKNSTTKVKMGSYTTKSILNDPKLGAVA